MRENRAVLLIEATCSSQPLPRHALVLDSRMMSRVCGGSNAVLHTSVARHTLPATFTLVSFWFCTESSR